MRINDPSIPTFSTLPPDARIPVSSESKGDGNFDPHNLGTYKIVTELPPVSEAEKQSIYFKGPLGGSADKYESWVIQDGSWLKIGELSKGNLDMRVHSDVIEFFTSED